MSREPFQSTVSSRRSMSKSIRQSQFRYVFFAAVAAIAIAVTVSTLVRPSAALTNNGSITAFSSPLTEDFNTLATGGTTNAWVDNSTLPGWYAQFELAPANPSVYIANAGGTNNGA